MGKYVVTGAAGFIGSHLVDRLLSRGHEVLGIDSFEDYYARAQKEANVAQARAHASFELLEANILEVSAGGRLADLVRGSDCVYHLAAQAGVRASWGGSFRVYSDNNVLGTQMVLEACTAAGNVPLIYASSSSVYGDSEKLPLREDAVCRPHSPYGVTKLAGEHLAALYARNFGLHTVSLRFFTVYGPRQRPDMAFHKFIRAMLNDEPIALYGDGSQTRDFTYVDDIVDGLLAAPRAEMGTVVNLGGGHRVTLAEAIATLGRVLGIEPRLVREPTQAGDVRDTWADTDRAARLLGFVPRVPLERGLAEESAWLRAQTS